MTKPVTNSRLSDARLTLNVLRTQMTLFVERLWPASLPVLGVGTLFVLVTLFGLWQLLPGLLHYALLGLFVGLTVYYLVKDLARLDWPTRREALSRLEQDSALEHAPLQALEDQPFAAKDADNPLWQSHLQGMKAASDNLRLDKARSAEVDQRDPYALRYAGALLTIAAVFLAWGDIRPRFWQAFSPQMASGVPVTVDLWIDPPSYTGKAPITLLQSASPPDGVSEQITVPAGSVLNARITGNSRFDQGRIDIHTKDGREQADLENTAGTLAGEVTLTQNTAVVLSVQGRKANWPVAVTPDRAPNVVFRDAPSVSDENRVRMVVEIRDDHGITEAAAVLSLDPEQPRPTDAPAIDQEVVASTVRVPVGGISGIEGPRTAELDLTDHPWAGLDVLVRLEVKDGAGNTAETLSEKVTLPVREFFNPLAQAIIHERRNLAVAPAHWPTTTRALGALTLAPDRFFDKPKDYLLLRTAYWDMLLRSSDWNLTQAGVPDENRRAEITEVVDGFWPLALQLEDQALELARRALEAAQTALREALERGAPPGEIASLVEDLRLAMRNYIQALAESGQAVADENAPSEELGASDLNEMLDSINDLTQSGANNAARQMLSSLEQMLENLKISGQSSSDGATGRGGDASGQGQGQQGQSSGEPGQNGGPGSQAMGAAGDLIGKQRELADETFDSLRDQYGLEGAGEAPRDTDDIATDQQALASQLSEMMEDMSGVEATESGEEIAESFQEALDFMEGAAAALEAGNPNAANQFQEQALDALRAGADGIAEEVMKAQEELAGDETGAQPGENGFTGEAANIDPLGRPYGNPAQGNAIGIPDLSNPERARELVEKLRQRLSEPGLSRAEIEYLERLLQRF